MAYLVDVKCVNCKYTYCVNVCPVNCFYEGENFIVINPDECIDCSLCKLECPVEAIHPVKDVQNSKKMMVKVNYDLSKILPNVKQSTRSVPRAERWKVINQKVVFMKLLER
jgi:ferredoxin